MLEELLKSSPGAAAAPGDDPLSSVTVVEAAMSEIPGVEQSPPDAVPGSAGAVSFVIPEAAPSVPATPVVMEKPVNPLASIP